MSEWPAAWAPALARLKAGALSPPVALAQMILSGDPPDATRLAALAAADDGLADLAVLAADHVAALEQLAALATGGIDAEGEDLVAATGALFDRLAAASPEAAVAFYSLGDAGLLARATAELAAVVRGWIGVEGRDLADFGCGIGRLAVALAPQARSIVGVDVSAAMVREARARAETLTNVRIEHGDGRSLSMIGDASLDAVVAADSFPYLVRAGIVDTMLGEIARVLRPDGDLLVFNWSYRGDLATDVAEAESLGRRHGFAVERAGETPFVIWDGIGFHLRKCA